MMGLSASDDQKLQPSDIMVMVPDMEIFAPISMLFLADSKAMTPGICHTALQTLHLKPNPSCKP
jgi:hypothetical protein